MAHAGTKKQKKIIYWALAICCGTGVSVAARSASLNCTQALIQSSDGTDSRLRALLPDRPFQISAPRASELMQATGLDEDALLLALVPLAREFARPDLSRYSVGTAARATGTGNIYLGANLEFSGAQLGQTVHAEQFVVALMASRGESGLEAMAFAGTPCGHCRQFLNELQQAGNIRLLLPQHGTFRLSDLLPLDFGPAKLGVSGALLTAPPFALELPAPPDEVGQLELLQSALNAARYSYTPYTRSPAGVALRLKDSTLIAGSYLESVAFNPSLSPLQVALANLVAAHRKYDEITDVLLVELIEDSRHPSHAESARALIHRLSPKAVFGVISIDFKSETHQ